MKKQSSSTNFSNHHILADYFIEKYVLGASGQGAGKQKEEEGKNN